MSPPRLVNTRYWILPSSAALLLPLMCSRLLPRFLTPAEQRYAAIEGEALAVAWGLEHSRYFTQGCDNLIVITDHKPLVKILGDRTLDEITNLRLFRLKQRTVPWRFEIQHLPGKCNHAADAI